MSSKAKKLALGLLRENRKNGRSWRVIAREDYGDKVSAGTINRFALSKGTWIPKDEEMQILLGLKRPRTTARDTRPLFDRPVAILLWQLHHREEFA